MTGLAGALGVHVISTWLKLGSVGSVQVTLRVASLEPMTLRFVTSGMRLGLGLGPELELGLGDEVPSVMAVTVAPGDLLPAESSARIRIVYWVPPFRLLISADVFVTF